MAESYVCKTLPYPSHNNIIIVNNTYIVAVALGHEHVHLGRLGADDLNVQRLGGQVDLAPVCLVDRHRRNLAQYLTK